LNKAKTSQKIKNNIRRIAENFKGLLQSKGKRKARTIVRVSRKVKRVVSRELRAVRRYIKQVTKAKRKVKRAIRVITNQIKISKKKQRKNVEYKENNSKCKISSKGIEKHRK